MSQSQQRYPGVRDIDEPLTDTGETVTVHIGDRARLKRGSQPSSARDLWSSEGLGVFVLSGDSELIATVREAAGNYYPVTPIASWSALRDAVGERRCGVALLDLDSVNGPLPDRLEELSELDPAVVPLVACAREQANSLMNLLAERRIHRLLIKPPTAGITRVLLESSVSRFVELRQGEQPRLRMEVIADKRPTPRRSGRFSAWLLAACLVMGSLGAVVWFGWVNEPEPPPVVVRLPGADEPQVSESPALPADTLIAVPVATEPSPETAEASGAPEAVERPVTRPANAVSTDPEDAADDTPATPLSAAAASAPDSTETVSTEQTVPEVGPAAVALVPGELETLFGSAESALIEGDLEEAERLLQAIEGLEPGTSRLAFLRAQLEREQTRAAAEVAAALAAAAAPSELTSLIGLARTRLDQDQLAVPDGDNALEYYARAVAVDAQAPEVQTLAVDLGRAVLTAAEIALAEGRFSEAGELFTEAQNLGVSDEDLVGLELSLVYARDSLVRAEQDSLLAEARERLAQGALFEPATGSALGALLEARRLNPDHPGLEPAFAELEPAIRTVAEDALGRADWDGAAAAIGALSRSGAPLNALEPLRAELRYRQTQEAYLAEASPANELNIVQLEPPVYPARAVARGVEGWVDLEFVVDRQGLPRDVVVTAAEPLGEFEAAALAATETYVFEPFELDGQLYERRIVLRMRFALE